MLQRRMSPVLGYLLIGGLIGPYGLGLLADESPLVASLVISEIDGVRALAELGVVFLLFTIGLELSFTRLPETVEGSLQLAGRVLSGYGLEDEAVQRRLQLERCAIERF